MSPRTERTLLVGILVVALVVRLAYVFALRGNPYFEAPILDPAYNVDWARSLARGDAFAEGAYFRAPLYVWFLALTQVVGDGLLLPRLLQCVLGVVTVLLTWSVGRRAFGPREGLLAAACAATCWVLVYFDGELLIPTLATPLYLAAIHATLGAEQASPRRVALAGLLWGIATLARPNVLLLSPLLALWLWRSGEDRAAGLRRAAGLAAGWLLAVLPITTYNAVAGGEFVLVSTQGGVNFWIGNHPGADGHTARVPGTVGDDFRATHTEAAALARAEAGRDLTPGGVSRHYASKAWDFLFSKPTEAAALLARKAGLFLQDQELGNNQPVLGTALAHAPWLPWISVPFWALVALGAVGFALAVRRAELMPLTGFLVMFAVSVVAFFVCSRFRAPWLPPLMIFAAHGACELARRGRDERGPVVVLGGAAVLVLAGLGLAARPDRALAVAQGLSHLAIGYERAGELDRAGALHERALALAGDDAQIRLARIASLETTRGAAAVLPEVRAILGDHPGFQAARELLLGLLNRSQRYPQLLTEAQALIEDAPNLASAHYYRGVALFGLGRLPEAAPCFERAMHLDPAGSQPAYLLGEVLRRQGRPRLAIAALQTAVTNDHFPGARRQRVAAHVALARGLMEQGDHEAAREVARLLAKREPEAPESVALLGEVGG